MTRQLALLLALICTIGGYIVIQKHRQDAVEDRALSAEADAARLAGELSIARLSERVVTQYVDRVQVVRERGKTITQEIPVYVTAEADARCDVPVGFVRLHDAAAQSLPIDRPAGDPDAPAPGVTLSAVAGTVAGNYGTCHEVREQLISLQDFVSGLEQMPPR
ncbi:hypothetical protein [Lysobacter sp. CA199]|uniref:hypothetical protein n=1 Tax=Lysobacter sp. CA199 TaxID=3455608 RepID=UPI003F8D27FD